MKLILIINFTVIDKLPLLLRVKDEYNIAIFLTFTNAEVTAEKKYNRNYRNFS